MSVATVRGGFDTYADRLRAARSFYGAKFLRLDSGDAEAFVYFKSPVPRGATVTRAVLRFRARGASSGSRVLSARRVAASWKARRVTWQNRPGVTGTAATVTVGALADRDLIEIDVTDHLQTIANGAANYGWKITTDATQAHSLYGMDSGRQPTLFVEWHTRPGKPTGLKPAGTVSVPDPLLSFDYVKGSEPLAAVEVQISPTADEATAWNSGVVSTTVPEFALAGSTYPGLTEGASTQWRVRVTDTAGQVSEWSSWATVARKAKAPVTITIPSTDPGLVYDVSPVVAWTFGATQSAWRVLIAPASDPSNYVYDSGKISGTETSHEVAKPVLLDDTVYRLTVQAWDDDLSRVSVPGDPVYSVATRDFTVDDDLAQTPPEGLTAVQEENGPGVVLTWTRLAVPDSWTVLRDGVPVATGLSAVDTLVSGSTFSWTDPGALPNRPNVYAIKAVTDKAQSAPSAAATVTPEVEGIWIVDLDEDVRVTIWGNEDGSWTQEDDASVYTPVGSTEVVRVVSGMRGWEGSLSGYVINSDADEAALYHVKENPSRRFRIVLGDVNFEALVGNVRISPSPTTRRGQYVKAVSFDFWQIGDLPFSPRI